MTTSKLKQKDLVDFGDAAAGHFGLLTDASGALVVKPCSATECAFYETCAAQHPDFALLIPTFMGKLSLSTPEQQKALVNSQDTPTTSRPLSAVLQAQDISPEELLKRGQEAAAKAAAHGKKLETEQAIVLENVAAGFVKPNILDVKLGGRLWDDDAPAAKRARLDQVSGETTSGSLGFRVAGMRVWKDSPASDAEAQVDGQVPSAAGVQPAYEVFDKHYGRNLTAANVNGAFEKFFRGNNALDAPLGLQRRAVLELCEQYLQPIESVLASKESRMYSASILLVTEGDDAALSRAFQKMEELQKKEEAGQNEEEKAIEQDDDDHDDDDDEESLPKICAVKLIDFAHARWTPGEGPDKNMLQGIASVRKILGELLEAD